MNVSLYPTHAESVQLAALRHAQEDGEFAARCLAICNANAALVMPDDGRPQPIRTLEAMARLACEAIQ